MKLFDRPAIISVFVLMIIAVAAGDLSAQDISDPDFTYHMFYPKYAKGSQPTAWDVGEIDSINLYNGGLSLTIPLGPPLIAGADLAWQLNLYYSSKFWSWDKRLNGLECQGKGYIVGDAHAGLGWTFKFPHILIRQQRQFGGDFNHFLDSVISSDGARHQLRRCIEGWDCRDGEPRAEYVDGRFREYWYSADGSGWRIYRDRSIDEWFFALSNTERFIGEHNGLRYYFELRNVQGYGPLNDWPITDTDFLSQARGWYCTRIESIRWPGPRIEIEYDTRPDGSPVPEVITAYDVQGNQTSRAVASIDEDELSISSIEFEDGAGATRLTYEFQYERGKKLRIRSDYNPNVSWPVCGSNPDLRTFTEEFSYLTDIRLATSDGLTAAWNFGIFQEEPDPPGEPDGELDVEPRGRIRHLTMPTGALIDYQYEKWIFHYPGLGKHIPQAPGPLLADKSILCVPGIEDAQLEPPDPPPGPGSYDAGHQTWAVVSRKIVDNDNRLLEWNEYLRGIMSGPLFNALGLPFDFANTKLSAHRDGPPLVPDPEIDPEFADHFYSGVAVTTVRRHLIVDDDPGEGAEDLPLLAMETGTTTEVPSARFDDTEHIFASGRFFYDANGDGKILGDNEYEVWGSLPLEGRPLEIRSYRGPHHIDGELPWYCTTAEHPRLERRTTFTYTMDREDERPPDRRDDYHAYLSGYEQYSGGRQENVEIRRQTTEYSRAALLEDQNDETEDPLYAGSESWYERDNGCLSLGCLINWRSEYTVWLEIADPVIPTNNVLTVSTSDFVADRPTSDDFDLYQATIFEKDFTTSIWLPGLTRDQTASLVSPSSFERTSSDYYANGAVHSVRRHLHKLADLAGDVLTSYDYWSDIGGAPAYAYGQTRTISVGTGGSIDSLTGASYANGGGDPYSTPYTREDWVLCPQGAAEDGHCPNWKPAPTNFGGTGELQRRVSFDPFWRRATGVTDGNGDGLAVIEHDDFGRLTYLEPTGPSKARTWLEYDPELRWSEVRIENESGSKTLVQRTEFDGLGRTLRHAVRRAGTSGNIYDPSEFRHQLVYLDGVGTAWATSHMLPTRNPLRPVSLQPWNDWEIIAAVDPFGRAERAVGSDGGLVLSGYRGNTWSQTLILDPDLGGLSRTIIRTDARGLTTGSWEDMGAPAADPPRFLRLDEMVPWRFVRGNYEYDVAGRNTKVEINGRDGAGLGRTQARTWRFDGLGNLLSHTFPEHGTGNGTMNYEAYDAFGTPHRTVFSSSPYQAIETETDAAGRQIERWALEGSNRYLLGSVTYGNESQAHDIGKPIEEIRYNLVGDNLNGCPNGCIEPTSISVINRYLYSDDQGLLSNRTTEVGFGGEGVVDGSQTFSLDYEYDRRGNVRRIYYPELAGLPGCDLYGPTIDKTWGPVALSSISDASTSQQIFSSPTFDAATGMLTGWYTPAGTLAGTGLSIGQVWHKVEVDGSRSRPSRILAKDPGNTVPPLFDTGTYSYDAAGNIREVGPWVYDYDDLGRLTSSEHPTHSVRGYTYDELGNLVKVGDRDISVDGRTNRLSESAYDLRGNLSSETTSAGWTRNFHFDLENQLTAAWATGPSSPEDQFGFAYDLSGERVLKYRVVDGSVLEATLSIRDQEGNVLTDFLWSPDKTGGSKGTWRRLSDHIYLGRRPIVHRLSQGTYPVTYITVVTDHLQSTRMEISDLSDLSTTKSFSFWPYGEFAHRTGTPTAKHLFTAHEREDTGTEPGTLSDLDYMHARFYSSDTNRFLSVDPVSGIIGSSQSRNRYSYVRGNPLSLVDPDGRTVWDIADVGFFVVSVGNLWKKALNGVPITKGDNFQAVGDTMGLLPVLPSIGTLGRTGQKVTNSLEFTFDISISFRSAKASSRRLGKNLEAAGVVRTKGTAAHHIVAGGSAKADEARAILAKFGVDINSAENGVFLPQKTTSTATGAFHPRIHTNTYYDEVNRSLRQATTKDEVLEVLESIRAGLLHPVKSNG